MKPFAKGFLRNILAVGALLAPTAWIVYKQDFHAVSSIGVWSLASCLLLTVLTFVCSGIQYYRTLARLGCRMHKADIVLYPLINAFWGMIVPMQGSVLFGILYLRLKYRFRLASSAVMFVFLYLINFLFAGFAWLFYALVSSSASRMVLLVAALMLGMPFYLLVFRILLRHYGRLPLVPVRLQDGLCECLDSLHGLLSNMRELAILVALQFLRQLLMAMMYFSVGKACGFKVSFLWGYLVAVSQDLALVFKFTPGNIGLAEMVSGLVSGIAGVSPIDGATVSLICTVVNVCLCLCAGFAASWLFLHSVNLDFAGTFRSIRPGGGGRTCCPN